MIGDYIKDINDFTIIRFIDEGSYGKLYLVEDKNSGKNYACKFSKKGSWTFEEQKAIYNEIDALSKISNPAVLSLYGFTTLDSENKFNPSILIEYMENGSLESVLEKERHSQAPLEWCDTTKYINIIGIALGMKYLNSKGMCHRDLKPLNVLFDKQYFPKISDLGTAKLSTDKRLSSFYMESFVGSPLYVAPEILEDKEYNYKVDVYSYSMILYELITGKKPMTINSKSQYIFFQSILKGKRPDVSIISDIKIKEFLQKCWSANPDERPSFNEIVNFLLCPRVYSMFNVDKEIVNDYLQNFGEKLKTQNEEMDVNQIGQSESNSNQQKQNDDDDSNSNQQKQNADDDSNSQPDFMNQKEENFAVDEVDCGYREMDEGSCTALAKIVLAGIGPCGKTSILRQLTEHKYEEILPMTYELDSKSVCLATSAGGIKLQIFDTPGAEKLTNMATCFYRGSNSVIIVLDATCESYNKKTWKTILLESIDRVKENIIDSLICIALNKCDSGINIPLNELESIASENNCRLFKISATDLKSIRSMFAKIADDLAHRLQIAESNKNHSNHAHGKSHKECIIA